MTRWIVGSYVGQFFVKHLDEKAFDDEQKERSWMKLVRSGQNQSQSMKQVRRIEEFFRPWRAKCLPCFDHPCFHIWKCSVCLDLSKTAAVFNSLSVCQGNTPMLRSWVGISILLNILNFSLTEMVQECPSNGIAKHGSPRCHHWSKRCQSQTLAGPC